MKESRSVSLPAKAMFCRVLSGGGTRVKRAIRGMERVEEIEVTLQRIFVAHCPTEMSNLYFDPLSVCLF